MSIDYNVLSLPKGKDHWIERRERRKAVAAFELQQKALVRKRDRICRWPKCERCAEWHAPLEVAHVLGAKGMGGDHGLRSLASDMMLLDRITHQQQERHQKEIRPLTLAGTDGPVEFWAKDEHDRFYLVAREIVPFVLERD